STVVSGALRSGCGRSRGVTWHRAERDGLERRGHAWSNELIAITGGSGFVGSHVVDALLGAGYEVRVIDPKPPMQPNVEWADVDMLDQDSVTDALKNAHAVFHLAAMADVNDIVADPAES